MQNSTSSPRWLILGYRDLGDISYFYSSIALVGFMIIVLCNCTVISTILMHRSLHEPMYIFISALCVNCLYSSSALFPSLFINLVSKSPYISYKACIVQVFCLFTSGTSEISLLVVMAYDRYVCICNPLSYATIMTLTTSFKLIAAALTYSFLMITIQILLTARLPLCDNVILKIYCDNWSVVRLSCTDTTINNIMGLFATISTLVIAPLLIIFSYISILKVCSKSRALQDKAMQTCAPQLISIFIFVSGCLFELLLYRFVPSSLPYELRVFTSVEALVVPPLVNPFLYGWKVKAIKTKIGILFYKVKPKLQKESLWFL